MPSLCGAFSWFCLANLFCHQEHCLMKYADSDSFVSVLHAICDGGSRLSWFFFKFRFCTEPYHPLDTGNVEKYVIGDKYTPGHKVGQCVDINSFLWPSFQQWKQVHTQSMLVRCPFGRLSRFQFVYLKYICWSVGHLGLYCLRVPLFPSTLARLTEGALANSSVQLQADAVNILEVQRYGMVSRSTNEAVECSHFGLHRAAHQLFFVTLLHAQISMGWIIILVYVDNFLSRKHSQWWCSQRELQYSNYIVIRHSRCDFCEAFSFLW